MSEQIGDRIDFTVFEPGTTHPTRGFPIGRCSACRKPGVVWPDEDGTTFYTHYATVGESYLASTEEEECEVPPPAPTA
jgi:hypothetical protein